MINLELLAEKGAIASKDLELFQFADTPEEAFRLLQEGLTEHLNSDYEAEMRRHEESAGPMPNAQQMMGPDIAKTR